jgi:pimeloyl-ACP methyl ester carboxylesterase
MTSRLRRLVLLACLLALGACRQVPVGRPEGSCTHVQAVREVRGVALCEDAWSCQRPPNGRFDRIGLHRLVPCEDAIGPVVLYLPGMHMNGELPVIEPRHDLRAYLAVNGIRTWGLDYRTHAVPADAAPDDLTVVARWDAETFADDAAWAVGFVRGGDPGPLYLAGFSYGASLAYRLAAAPGDQFAGLIILDGAAGAGDSDRRAAPAVIDVGGSRLPYAERQSLLTTVLSDPRAPSPLPGYASAGEALAGVLHTAPSFGGDGGLASDGVSDVRVLATLLRGYDRWWPRAALEAGDAPRPAQQVPVLAFASSRMGPDWSLRVEASARAYGGADTTVRELPGYGHLDVLVARRAAREVFEPTLVWLGGRGR